jgi:hypothetical protein
MHNQFKNIAVGAEFVLNGFKWIKVSETLATSAEAIPPDAVVFSSLQAEFQYEYLTTQTWPAPRPNTAVTPAASTKPE